MNSLEDPASLRELADAGRVNVRDQFGRFIQTKPKRRVLAHVESKPVEPKPAGPRPRKTKAAPLPPQDQAEVARELMMQAAERIARGMTLAQAAAIYRAVPKRP